VALLDDADLAYMRDTQGEAMPTTATLKTQAAPTRTALGGRVQTPDDDEVSVAIRIDNDPNPPENLATEFGIHLVRITCPVATLVNTGDLFTVSSTETYRVVSHGDTDPWTTAQRLWAVRVVTVHGGA
jgi:hypothetical protein